MNLFKNLPTSNKKSFNTDGFEGEREYEDPVELLGTRNEESVYNVYNSDVLKSLQHIESNGLQTIK